jgi:hypothetical protein
MNRCNESPQEPNLGNVEQSEPQHSWQLSLWISAGKRFFERFFEFCDSHGPGITALATVILAFITFWYLIETWNLRNLAYEQLQLGNLPGISIEFDQDGVIVKNIGRYPLLDIEMHRIAYQIQRDPRKILERLQVGGKFLVAEKLPRNDFKRLSIPEVVFPKDVGHYPRNDVDNYRSIVLVYRREVDQKCFVKIEPFIAGDIKGKTMLIPLYADHHFAGTGPPSIFISILQEIENTERVLFRAGES